MKEKLNTIASVIIIAALLIAFGGFLVFDHLRINALDAGQGHIVDTTNADLKQLQDQIAGPKAAPAKKGN